MNAPRARQLRQPGRHPTLRTRNHPKTALGPATQTPGEGTELRPPAKTESPARATIDDRFHEHAELSVAPNRGRRSLPAGFSNASRPCIRSPARVSIEPIRPPDCAAGKGVAAVDRSLPAGIGTLTISNSAQRRAPTGAAPSIAARGNGGRRPAIRGGRNPLAGLSRPATAVIYRGRDASRSLA